MADERKSVAEASSEGKDMSPEEVRLIQEIVLEYCGMGQSVASGFFLERRLRGRLQALGLPNFREYYHYLRYDPGGPRELDELVEKITTNETYFFREQYQLDAFTEEILPELYERLQSGRSLTVWSAGCSSGEEVYTLAMLLLEQARFMGWRLRVVGSDISRRVLSCAREGVYRESSFRTTDRKLMRRYFDREPDGRHAVTDEVRHLCSFGRLNLVETERYGVVGPCHAIFCRNVLMYLAPEVREKVVAAFYELLRPGGYLLLGHSESLLNVSTRFELVHLEHDLVYRKPLEEGGSGGG